MTIKDVDKGYNALFRAVGNIKNGSVDVGIFADVGAKKQSPGLTVLDVATFNEFGLGVPERSFIRAYVDENEARIKAMIKALALLIVQGKITRDAALEKLGVKIQGEIQKRIADGIEPANAPATIAKKGSDKPLIDTGQLRSSVTYKVKK